MIFNNFNIVSFYKREKKKKKRRYNKDKDFLVRGGANIAIILIYILSIKYYVILIKII